MKFLIDGVDRLGKSTLIENIQQAKRAYAIAKKLEESL